MESYRTLHLPGEGELIEKKSRFIATASYIGTDKEALAFIESMKKKYWDATHNCWAYVTGPVQTVARCSDDGEPQGTAGRPMLDVLLGEKIYNICVVVTRYFGGTLLGTGGLVRAYSRAVQESLKNSLVVERRLGRKIRIACDYNTVGKVLYQIGQMGIPVLDTQYTDHVETVALAPAAEAERVKDKLVQATNARAALTEEGETWFAAAGKEVLLFPQEP